MRFGPKSIKLPKKPPLPSLPGGKALERLVVWKSEDGGELWEPVLPESVPSWVKEDSVLARLVAGEGAQAPDSESWYIATKYDD